MTAQRCYTGAAPALEIQHAGHHIQMHGDFVPSEIQIAGPTVLFAVMTLQIAAQFTWHSELRILGQAADACHVLSYI